MVIEIVGGSVAEDGRSMARDYQGDQDFMRIIEILLLRRWDLEENQESGKYVI